MYNEMMDTIGLVNTVDPELAAAMDRELNRQRQNIQVRRGPARQALLRRLCLCG